MTHQQAVNMLESAVEYLCAGKYTDARRDTMVLFMNRIQDIREESDIDIYEVINYGYASREKYAQIKESTLASQKMDAPRCNTRHA